MRKTMMALLAACAALFVISMQLIAANDGRTDASGNARGPATSTAPTTQGEIDPGKVADINKLMEIAGTKQLLKQMVARILTPYKKYYPELGDHVWDEFTSDDSLRAQMDRTVSVYDKYFTHQEIKDLIAFYNSPVGQKYTRVMPAVAADLMTLGQEWGREIAAKIKVKAGEAATQPAPVR